MADTIMGLLNPTIAAIFAAVFAALWMRDRSNRTALVFAFGYVGLAAGFLVFHFTPDPDAIGWTLFMHTIYSVSAGCVCWAAADRVGQEAKVSNLLVISIAAAALIVVGSFGTDMNARLIAANTAYGLMFALTTQTLGRTGERSAIDRTIYWLFAISAAQFFIRPQLAMIVSGPMSAEAYRESDFYAIWMLMMGVVSLLLALALMTATVLDQWRKESEAAEVDPLSRLKMRRSFESAAMDMLDQNIDRRVRICMIVADIDHFKRVNDIWGHQAGDDAIAAFGELIGSTVRGTDLCGRIGGEEFCILVYDCEESAAKGLADRIRRKFASQEHEALGPDIRLTVSFGVTEWRSGEGYGKLFARADAALYRAKSNGRDRVETADAELLENATPEQEQKTIKLARTAAG
ncbi:MAG: GGDEF domain-containing protein [Pseudomonadota bacterium]